MQSSTNSPGKASASVEGNDPNQSTQIKQEANNAQKPNSSMVSITSTESHTVNGHQGNGVDKATGSSALVKNEEENTTTGNPIEASSTQFNKPATSPTSDNEQAGSDDSNDDQMKTRKRTRAGNTRMTRSGFLKYSLDKHLVLLPNASNADYKWSLKELSAFHDEIKAHLKDLDHWKRIVGSLQMKLANSGNLQEELKNEEQYEPKKRHKAELSDRVKICGVVNTRGRPCQRTGYCPFHHKYASVKRDGTMDDDEDEGDGESSTEMHGTNANGTATTVPSRQQQQQQQQQQHYHHGALRNGGSNNGGSYQIVGVKAKSRFADMSKSVQLQISILLIAAAAMERRDLEDKQLRLKQETSDVNLSGPSDACVVNETTIKDNIEQTSTTNDPIISSSQSKNPISVPSEASSLNNNNANVPAVSTTPEAIAITATKDSL